MLIPFTQTLTWADINKHCNNIESMVVEHQDIRCLFGYDKITSSITSFNGPVMPTEVSEQDLNKFLEQVIDIAKKNKIYQINFRSLLPLRTWNASVEKEFIKFGFTHQEWKTFIVDLTPPEDDLIKNCEHSARKGIKKAHALGISIVRCSTFEEYLTNFLIPYSKITNRTIKENYFYLKL